MTSSASASYNAEDSQSPKAPPISPITPAAPFAVPVSHFSPDQPTSPRTVPPPRPEWQSQHRPAYTTQPSSIPLAEDDNIDAIALRAAIYTLEIQKEKSLRDIKTLQQLRVAAGENPEAFLEEYTAGRLRQETNANDPLGATFENNASDDEDVGDTRQDLKTSAYPMIPSRQNVIRCPPINWAKYEIIGAPLDRLHEAQRRRPSPGEPVQGGDLARVQVQNEHFIHAPYDPFKDKLDTGHSQHFQPFHPMVTRNASTRPT